MIIERKRKRKESKQDFRISKAICRITVCSFPKTAGGRPTEDEFLGRGQHIKREGDFILVSFALQPAQECGSVKHGFDQRNRRVVASQEELASKCDPIENTVIGNTRQ